MTADASPLRPARRALACGFALLAACLCTLPPGCSDAKPVAGPVADATPAAPAAAPADSTPVARTAEAEPTEDAEPPLAGWDAPAAAIVISGEQHGYVEPCGCSEKQSGGLARRDDLIKQLADRGWTVAGLDLGGTLKRSRKQSELKFDFTHHALADMGYRALGLGVEELRMGADYLLGKHYETQEDARAEVPMVSANVALYGDRSVGTPALYRVFEAGGVRVGVTSVLGDSHAAKFAGNDLLAIDPAAEALPAALEAMDAESPDVRILLSHALPDESEALAEQFPQFDVVVTADGPEDGYDAQRVGETLVLRPSQKGKHVDVLGLYRAEDGTVSLKAEQVDLDKDRFETSARMVDRMRDYQEAIASLDLAATEPAVSTASGHGFAGAKDCGRCHKKAYAIWKDSKHAHALESLEKGRPGTEDWWVDRRRDPECLSCHVTGWDAQEVVRFDGGFDGTELTEHLAGNQCENCHGAGSAHSELEWAFAKGADMTEAQQEARRSMHLDKEWASKNLCVRCHDGDNSPHFDFETYWPKVAHSGRD